MALHAATLMAAHGTDGGGYSPRGIGNRLGGRREPYLFVIFQKDPWF
jgi:hypothetical protein